MAQTQQNPDVHGIVVSQIAVVEAKGIVIGLEELLNLLALLVYIVNLDAVDVPSVRFYGKGSCLVVLLQYLHRCNRGKGCKLLVGKPAEMLFISFSTFSAAALFFFSCLAMRSNVSRGIRYFSPPFSRPSILPSLGNPLSGMMVTSPIISDSFTVAGKAETSGMLPMNWR